jgi:Family of unknown function (DUF6152)
MKKIVIASFVTAVLVSGAPALAHHSANAEFDTQKVITITGVLTKFENVNPHGWWSVDVKEADGKVTSWRLETPGVGGLINQGLKVKTELKVGETYTIKISPGWKDPDGMKIGIVRTITVGGKEYRLFDI